MPLHLRNPLTIFDLESTGTNVVTDRIVEISVVKLLPNDEQIVKTHKINPTVPIPVETSLIHGIYDKDVKDAPTFKSIAKSLAKFLEGSDLGGFNVLKFDIPLLVEEFLRVGIDFDVSKRKIVDALKIFHMMEKRTLSAAYKFYCDQTLEGAHSAEADTLATAAVIKAQVDRYDGQDVFDNLGEKLGTVTSSVDSLHKISASNLVDLAGRMVLNKNGDPVFNFGKHRHKLVTDVLSREKGYYDWMMKGDFPQDTKRKLTEIKLKNLSKLGG